MDERPLNTKRKMTLNGWEREEEEEERKVPTTREQLKRAHLVFRNMLLMCLSSFPQFAQFNVKYQDLEYMHSSWEKTSQTGNLLPARQCYCMLRGLHGERSTTKSMKDPLKEAMAAQKADTRLAKGKVNPSRPGHQLRPSGTKANSPRKGSLPKGHPRARTRPGQRTGQHPPRGVCSAAGITFYGKGARGTVEDPADVQSSRMDGPAPGITILINAQASEMEGIPQPEAGSSSISQKTQEGGKAGGSHAPTTTTNNKREADSAQQMGSRPQRPKTGNEPTSHLTPRREEEPTQLSNSTQPLLTTANDRSGQLRQATPQSALDLHCPWTKEIPARLQQRLLWNQSSPQGVASRAPRHSSCKPGRMIQLHCARQCCRNPNTGQ